MTISQDILEAQGRVRPMARHDLPVVSAMIARLARHHGEEPAIDAARLQDDLFGAAPWLHGLVAERFGYVVGYALMTQRYRAQLTQRGLDLHHLFVIEGSRGLGLGRKLVEAVADFAREEGCAFLVVGAREANRQARSFYGALGFEERVPDGRGFAMAL